MMEYRPVAHPATAEDIDDMWQSINQAYSLAVLLESLDETNSWTEIDELNVFTITAIGGLLTKLLSQPMDAVVELSRDKRFMQHSVTIDGSFLATVGLEYARI